MAHRYCTRSTGRAEWRHGLTVQFQQHRAGIGRNHLKSGAGRELAIGTERTIGAANEFAAHKNAQMGGSAISRQRSGTKGVRKLLDVLIFQSLVDCSVRMSVNAVVGINKDCLEAR